MSMDKLLILIHVTFVSGRVFVNTTVNITVSSIECRSLSPNLNIQFNFKNKTSNYNRLIAECDVPKTGCYLVDQSLGKFYTVTFTGDGGLLIIIQDTNQTRGQYTCCETFNKESCVSTEIGAQTQISSEIHSDRSIHVVNNFNEADNPRETRTEYIFHTDHSHVNNAQPSVLIASNVTPWIAIVLIVAILAGVYLFRKRRTTLAKCGSSLQADAGTRQALTVVTPEMTVLQPVAEEKMAADTKILSSVHVGVKPPDDDKKMHYDQNLQTISKPSDEENHKTSSIMDGSYEEPETSLKERNELYAYVNIHHEESTDDFIQVEDGEISSREQIPLLPMTLSDRARSPRNIHVEQESDDHSTL